MVDGDTELIGLFWPAVGTLATGYVASVPLDGTWVVHGVVINAAPVNSVVLPHLFQFAARSEVPTSQVEINEGEELFPFAARVTPAGHMLRIVASGVVLDVRGRFRFPFKGRRLVGGWFNGAVGNAAAEALFVMERVRGGSGD